MGGCGSNLDCTVIMQPNPGWGIIVIFRTVLCIPLAEATICLCFAEGALLDFRTSLDNLVGGMKSRCSGTRIWDIFNGGAELVKSRIGVIRFFGGSWKHAFSSANISERVRLVRILTGQIGGIRDFWSSTEKDITHFRRGPFTHHSMLSGQKTKSVRFIAWSL